MPRGRVKGSKNKDNGGDVSTKKVAEAPKVKGPSKADQIKELKARLTDLAVPRDVQLRGGFFKGVNAVSLQQKEDREAPDIERRLRELGDDTKLHDVRQQ